MKKITLLVTVLFSAIHGAYKSVPLVQKHQIINNQPAHHQQAIKPLPAQEQQVTQPVTKQIVKAHEINEFQAHEHGKPVLLNKLTGKRAIKIAVHPRDLIQTSKHFALEKKHSAPDNNGKITWKVRVKHHGKGWIKIRDKETGTHIYHFDIENNHIKKSKTPAKKVA